jgi:hypothetical protein
MQKTWGSRLFVFLLGIATLSYAQVTSRISGSVVDQSGAFVPGATVDLMLPGGDRALFSAVTTSEGLFGMIGVPAGTYTLTVSANGFKKVSRTGIELTPGIETSLGAIRLDVGNTTEVVEVSASIGGVQTANAEVSVNISKNQVAALPSLNRNPQGFIDTQAGVSLGRNGVSIFNGQRTSFTNVTLDGINIQDNFIRTNAADFSPNLLLLDQVAEMTVSTSNTNPAAGGGASQVIFITPSGTNQFHGSVFWSNRNNALAANTWFNNRDRIAKPFLNQNQTGGTLGGPIKKDKLFFYTNFELFRLRQQTAQNRTILTQDAENGIFTYLGTGGAVQKVNILQALGVSTDPTTAAIIKQLPSPGQINNFRVGDSSGSLLRNTGGYSFNQRSNRDRNNYTGKLDYTLSPRNSITGTYLYNTDLLDRGDVNTLGFDLVPKVNNDDRVVASSVAWRSVPTPTMTNEVRAGFNRAPALFISSNAFDTPIILAPVASNTTGLFSNPLNTFRSQGRYTNTYNLSDNAAWLHGKHNVQFGYQMQRIYTQPYNDAGITAQYTLGIGTGNSGLTNAQLPGASATDLNAANDLLALLHGYVTSDTQTYNATTRTSGFVAGATNQRNWFLGNHALYVTDTWRVTPRLTANLGLRYEYYAPVTEQNGLALLPTLNNNNVVSTLTSATGTLNFAGNGTGRSFYNADRNNFGPNIGLAYVPFKDNGNTVIRAGYSVNYVNDEFLTALSSNVGNNSGLAQTVTASGLKATVSPLPGITTPVFSVPRTYDQNHALNSQAAFAAPNPDLVTPYVQQWNIGVQHDYRGFLFDLRYVGNHGTKLLRGVDLNQINFNAGGFYQDFLRAQSNGNLALAKNGVFDPSFNAAIAGSQQLTVFPLLAQAGNLSNATNRTMIATGQVAELARSYQIAGNNGPINFFPNSNAQTLWELTNNSNSTYNGLQFDVRSREHKGLLFQANYTYSKIMTDATSGSDNNFQNRNEALLDNNNPKLEKSRATFDLTHVIKGNFVYRIPAGNGHRVSYKPINRVLEGWQMSGLFVRQSGIPFSILSQYGTFDRAGQSGNNTVDTTVTQSQLNNLFQLRFAGNGPYFFNSSAIGADGRAIQAAGSAPFTGQVFFTPAAGTVGSLGRRVMSGPWDWTLDFGALKTTKITERQSFVLRFDSTNFFNHPSWSIGDQLVTSTTFGQITTQQNGRRVFQITAQYRF